MCEPLNGNWTWGSEPDCGYSIFSLITHHALLNILKNLLATRQV